MRPARASRTVQGHACETLILQVRSPDDPSTNADKQNIIARYLNAVRDETKLVGQFITALKT
jgi:hypothetical protein